MTLPLARFARLLAALVAVAGFAFQLGGSAAHAHTAVPPVLRGSSQGVIGPVRLHAGLVVVRATSAGQENFAADLINQDPDSATPVTQDPTAWKEFHALFNVTGRFDGATAVVLKQDDDFFVHVQYASGAYAFTFEQPDPATTAATTATSFTGNGQTVTPYFQLAAGTYTLMAHAGASRLYVQMFGLDDQGGFAIEGDLPGFHNIDLINTTLAPGVFSVSITVPADGIYVISMNPDGAGPTTWSVDVQ